MHDQLTEAIERAAEFGAPAKTFHVGPEAALDFGPGRDPFDGMTVTSWVTTATHWTAD